MSILKLIFSKKDPLKVEAAKESARVQALKRQIKDLEEINISQSETIKHQLKQLKSHQEANTQDKMIDMAMSFLNPNYRPQSIGNTTGHNTPQNPPLELQTTLESGVKYSDNQLLELVNNIPAPVREQLKNLAYDKFTSVVKGQLPDISEESLKRGHEILKETP